MSPHPRISSFFQLLYPCPEAQSPVLESHTRASRDDRIDAWHSCAAQLPHHRHPTGDSPIAAFSRLQPCISSPTTRLSRAAESCPTTHFGRTSRARPTDRAVWFSRQTPHLTTGSRRTNNSWICWTRKICRSQDPRFRHSHALEATAT